MRQAPLSSHTIAAVLWFDPIRIDPFSCVNIMPPRIMPAKNIVTTIKPVAPSLEDANIKLVSVISDIVGMSGRRFLKAMIAGETNAMRLTGLGSARLKVRSRPPLRRHQRPRYRRRHNCRRTDTEEVRSRRRAQGSIRPAPLHCGAGGRRSRARI
jgi:hypothetical protein